MSVQAVYAEETCSHAAIFSRGSRFLQIPPQHPSDNPDGTCALQTAETFSPQICVMGLQGISLSDSFSCYKKDEAWRRMCYFKCMHIYLFSNLLRFKIMQIYKKVV